MICPSCLHPVYPKDTEIWFFFVALHDLPLIKLEIETALHEKTLSQIQDRCQHIMGAEEAVRIGVENGGGPEL